MIRVIPIVVAAATALTTGVNAHKAILSKKLQEDVFTKTSCIVEEIPEPHTPIIIMTDDDIASDVEVPTQCTTMDETPEPTQYSEPLPQTPKIIMDDDTASDVDVPTQCTATYEKEEPIPQEPEIITTDDDIASDVEIPTQCTTMDETPEPTQYSEPVPQTPEIIMTDDDIASDIEVPTQCTTMDETPEPTQYSEPVPQTPKVDAPTVMSDYYSIDEPTFAPSID